MLDSDYYLVQLLFYNYWLLSNNDQEIKLFHQSIPSIIPNDKSNTIKFTNACQTPIYNKPTEWPTDCKLSPFRNMISSGSAVDTAHPNQLTTYYKIKFTSAQLSTSAMNLYNL